MQYILNLLEMVRLIKKTAEKVHECRKTDYNTGNLFPILISYFCFWPICRPKFFQASDRVLNGTTHVAKVTLPKLVSRNDTAKTKWKRRWTYCRTGTVLENVGPSFICLFMFSRIGAIWQVLQTTARFRKIPGRSVTDWRRSET